MTEQELHDLMIRIDERTRNTWRVVEKMERHQAEQNGFIRDLLIRTRVNRILLGIGGTIGLLLFGAKIQGLW